MLLESADFFQQAWADLGTAVRTGQPAAEHVWGMPFYQYMATHTGVGAIFQQALPDDTSDPALFDGAMSDLNMLIFVPGCERTLAQYRALLSVGGFAITNVVATRALMSVIEGARFVDTRAAIERVIR